MESAIKDLESVYSNDDIVIMLLPEFLQNEGKLKEASAALEKIINEKPDDYFAWEKLLLVYFEERNWAMLEKAGKECATKFNRSVIAKLLYANGAMENKHYEVAIDELRKADILAGNNNAAKVQVLSMKAEVYYRMKNYTDAFKSFDEALSLNDTNLVVLNNYAYYLAEQNQKLNEAEKMAKEVVSKAKDNTTYLDTYAWVLYKQGKEREAARIMEKIINSGEKKDAEWFEHYGYILKKMGKCSEAVDEWKKALNIDKSKTELTREIENCEKRR
jgi:Tfp pilus assembly protein PilF